MLPSEWFDRCWVRAERSWPTGRRIAQPPAWAGRATAAALLAVIGTGGTYLLITAESTSEVIRELIAEPVEDPDVVVVPGPVVEIPLEEAPELFGDVEIGELPTYDLTGEGQRGGPTGPTLAPRPTDGGSAEGAPATDTDGPGGTGSQSAGD
jgi:hypothetical protein